MPKRKQTTHLLHILRIPADSYRAMPMPPVCSSCRVRYNVCILHQTIATGMCYPFPQNLHLTSEERPTPPHASNGKPIVFFFGIAIISDTIVVVSRGSCEAKTLLA